MESEILQMRFIKLRPRNSIFSTISEKTFCKFGYSYVVSQFSFSNDNEIRQIIKDKYKFLDIIISKLMTKSDHFRIPFFLSIAEELYEDHDVETIKEFFARMNLIGENYIKRNFYPSHIKYLLLCDEKLIAEIFAKKHNGDINMTAYISMLFALHNDELLVKFCISLNLDKEKFISDVCEIVRSNSYPHRISNLRMLLNT